MTAQQDIDDEFAKVLRDHDNEDLKQPNDTDEETGIQNVEQELELQDTARAMEKTTHQTEIEVVTFAPRGDTESVDQAPKQLMGAAALEGIDDLIADELENEK